MKSRLVLLQNEKTRKEIEDLVASKNVTELASRMNGTLTFGTAGGNI